MIDLKSGYDVEVCNTKMNFMEYMNYLEETRAKYKPLGRTPSWYIASDEGKSLIFAIHMNLSSRLGYNVKDIYHIYATEVTRNNFVISKISQSGGCPQIGTTDPHFIWHNNTVMKSAKTLNIQLLVDRLMARTPYVPDLAYDPVVDTRGQFFAILCSFYSERVNLESYVKHVEIFARRWMPKEDVPFIKTTIIERQDYYVFRLTCPLVLDNTLERVWEFQYNKHGDEDWYVTSIVEQCPKEHFKLRDQASSDHENYKNAATELFSVIDSSNYTALVCNTPMNYLEYISYLEETRFKYKVISTAIKYYIAMLQREYFIFAVHMNLTSRMGYEVKDIYHIYAHDIGKNNYVIRKIEQSGGCPQFGETDPNFIRRQGESMHSAEIKTKNEFAHRLLINSPYVPELNNDKLMDTKGSFSATLCTNPGYRVPLNRYIRYMDIFSNRWLIPIEGVTFLKTKILDADDVFIFRLSCPLIINETILRTWEFQFRCEYNKHGDQRWYVSDVNLHCPKEHFNGEGGLRTIYGETLAYQTMKGLTNLLIDGGWNGRFQFLNLFEWSDFIPVEIEVCTKQTKLNKSAEIADYLWRFFDNYNSTFKSASHQIETADLILRFNVYTKVDIKSVMHGAIFNSSSDK
ncbi:unnamed protein product [Caenorhabditis bovis]|uniref:NTF2-like domain-containing protein n=1 Tax=Caenorhabditis bovis TaxID=2654633 RepID=A0A8S1FEK5_9PELO|nr:unnamed protein product [Caenorhabditis bovis]